MKVGLTFKATIHAKNDAEAQVLAKKVDALLQKHAKMLLTVEGITLYTIVLDPKLTREP